MTDVGEDAEEGEPSYTVGGNANRAATLENSMEVPQKVENRATLGHLGGSVGQASAFGSGHDPRVHGSSPALGSLLSGELASSSPFAAPHARALSLSLCQINK